MTQDAVTIFAIVVIVLMAALLVGTEVAQNLRRERELDAQRAQDEADVGQGEPASEDDTDAAWMP